jgi:hypothetical protein
MPTLTCRIFGVDLGDSSESLRHQALNQGELNKRVIKRLLLLSVHHVLTEISYFMTV